MPTLDSERMTGVRHGRDFFESEIQLPRSLSVAGENDQVTPSNRWPDIVGTPNPSGGVQGTVKNVYLKRAKGLLYTPDGNLKAKCYTDADRVGLVDDRRSISRYCTFVGDNLVTWHIKKAVYRSLIYS
jgi:hypothetical protein